MIPKECVVDEASDVDKKMRIGYAMGDGVTKRKAKSIEK